jgi:hypothetical protein
LEGRRERMRRGKRKVGRVWVRSQREVRRG